MNSYENVASPWGLLSSYYRLRKLLGTLTKREILGRYRGSMLGLLWSFITPLTMIATYTLVFVFFFKNSWSEEHTQPSYFVIMLFCGLLPFNFFTEVISQSPSLILRFPNYVKRIDFPLQLLPGVLIGSSLFQTLMGLLILLPGIYGVTGRLPVTTWYLPLIWIPFVLFTLALSLLIAAIGVFIRDLNHGVGLVLNILFFLSPIFYPATIVPENLRWLLWLNPVACAILQIRMTCVTGVPMDYVVWSGQFIGSLLFLIGVIAWYSRVHKRFADVM